MDHSIQSVSTLAAIWLGVSIAVGLALAIITSLQQSIRDYFSFWKLESKKLQDVGYLAPKPGRIETAITRSLFKIKGYIECCKITIIGRENLPTGRTIIAGNHIDIGDTDVISEIVGRKAGRFLIALPEVPPEKPEGILMAMAGAIPVDQLSKRAKVTVISTAADALIDDGPDALLAIFPQGQLDPNEEITLESFKRGTAEIARRAAERLKPNETIWIVPLGIHYKNDELKVPLLNRHFKHMMNKLMPPRRDGSPFFSVAKYEAIGVIGEPIAVTSQRLSTQLPEDNALATKFLHAAVKSAHNKALDYSSKHEFKSLDQELAGCTRE